MMLARLAFLVTLLLVASVHCSPLFADKYHPVVIWHGLGDSAYSEGLQSLASQLREAYPGMYVHLISLGDNLSSDQKAGFFGNVNDQIAQVCEDLKGVKELEHGFDAVGFSQGGECMQGRPRLSRCAHLSALSHAQQVSFCGATWSDAIRLPCATLSPLAPSTWASPISLPASRATFSVDWQRVHFEEECTPTMHSRT